MKWPRLVRPKTSLEMRCADRAAPVAPQGNDVDRVGSCREAAGLGAVGAARKVKQGAGGQLDADPLDAFPEQSMAGGGQRIGAAASTTCHQVRVGGCAAGTCRSQFPGQVAATHRGAGSQRVCCAWTFSYKFQGG